MKQIFYIQAACIALISLCLPFPAAAESDLREFSGTPLPLVLHPDLTLEVIPIDVTDAQELVSAFPGTVGELVIVRIYWPDAARSLLVGVGTVAGETLADLQTYVVLQAPGEQKYLLTNSMNRGQLGRLALWPLIVGNDTGIAVMFSIVGPGYDARLFGFASQSDGALWELDTGSARSANGWFDIVDVDRNGLFELVTLRGMDGITGGFNYQAVRSFNQDSFSYFPDPESYRDFFQSELEWLNWVVSTTESIMLDPEPYMNRTGDGPYFSAIYEGTVFGFDSVVEVPVPEEEGFAHIAQFNQERANSFARVVSYRDQLSAWLAGGAQPSTWNIR